MKTSELLRRAVPRDRRGGALALAAVTIVGLLSMMAMTVDLGMAFTAKTEAQRVADASALAGASAFIDSLNANAAVVPAKERAREYAAQNYIRNEPVDTTTISVSTLFDQGHELDVQVIPDSQKVRVWVQRQGIGTFFARLLGVDFLGVKAMAAAEATTGGTVTCAWPMALPDIWSDADDDVNGNGIPDPGTGNGRGAQNQGEIWDYGSHAGDHYSPWDGQTGGTGYGSTVRDSHTGLTHDRGLLMVIKGGPGAGGNGLLTMNGASGNSGFIAPGNFQLYAMPDPGNSCHSRNGAAWVQANMRGCNSCGVNVGEPYLTQPGNLAAIQDPMAEVMARGEPVSWDPVNQRVENSSGTHVTSHPRIVTVALYDPTVHQNLQGSSQPITFNNFAQVFLEGGGQPPNFAIMARFLGVISGTQGPTQGSLVKYLRLVE